MDDAATRELLGAYALDACDDDEVAAVETLLARDPDALSEADRLRGVAAWLGATQALVPSPAVRDALFARAHRVRPPDGGDPALALYEAQTDRFDALLDQLEAEHLDVATFNGLTVRELVIHMAAMESAFAASVGTPTLPELSTEAIEPRTYELIDRFRDRPVSDAREVWRRSVDALRAWALAGTGRVAVPGVGFDLSRHSALVTRSFETWTHDDDVRRALGLALEVPPPEHLRLMAETSTRSVPLALAAIGRMRAGRRASIVLTGDGGGAWTLPLEPSADRPVEGIDETADVLVRLDVVDWCRLASQRMEPGEVVFQAEGSVELVDDIFAAAPAFATL